MKDIKQNLEDISNQMQETKHLTTLLEEHFFCLEEGNIKEEQGEERVLSEWWNLKRNLEEYRSLCINIKKKLDDNKKSLDSVISTLYKEAK